VLTTSRRFRALGWLAAVVIAGTCVQLPATADATPPSRTSAAVASAAASAPAPGTVQTSKGRDFWLAFPQNYSSDSGANPVLYLSGTLTGSGTVTIPGASFSQDFAVTPGQVAQVAIPVADSVTASDGIQPLGIHVTADTMINVYGVNQERGTSGAYLGLPVAALGTRYSALGYQGLAGLPTQLTVVATASATTLTVTPHTDVNGHPAGVAFTVPLAAGDVYQLQGSSSNGTEDVSGTTVESNLPVAVFGGAVCADVPVNYGACDHLVQQLPPTSAWGSNFLTVRFATRLKGDTYRVLANEDNTEVSVNGAGVAAIDAGEFYEGVLPANASTPGSEGTLIHTSHPALVAQYGNGFGFDGDFENRLSDPLMMLVPPAGQYLDRYTFAAPDVAGYSPYANLVVPTADIGQIRLDGVLVDSSLFDPISGSTYSGAQFPLSVGAHTLNGPDRFGLQVYEWGEADGFGFPGGMAMSFLYVDPQGPAPDLTSTAVAPHAQNATVTMPKNGSVTLVHRSRDVKQLVLPGVGTYSLDTDTGVITFTPVRGYAGTPHPVTYQITDSSARTAQGTYTPTVTPPAGPSATDVTSSGVGTTPQSVRIKPPSGGTIALVDGDVSTTEVVVDHVGTYELDASTGRITFVADAGFSGTAPAVTYKLTDLYGQTDTASYTPTVTKPARPTPAPITSRGAPGEDQTVSVPVPPGGSAHLVDSQGQPTSTLSVAGEGVYTIHPRSGNLTFTPATRFRGRTSGAAFRVTDAYGQSGHARYTPIVTSVVLPASRLTVSAPVLAKLRPAHPGFVHTVCAVGPGRATVCRVTLTTRLNGDRTEIGRGHTRSSVVHGVHRIGVVVHLTRLGRALAARPGGVRATAGARARVSRTGSWVVDSDRTRVVKKITEVSRSVHFVTDSSALRLRDRQFLNRLRTHVTGAALILCQGFTDNRGSAAYGMQLGLERAKAACAFLSRGTGIDTRVVSYGEARPIASNATAHGRWLNRRAQVILEY
jgi:CshA-type fibril repeat protein